ncbi:hypothetical protein KC332_g13528 [Hortaea werneckii]|uniref:MmgE/PrpD family protein n=2 Tax=Hortaea werneckii TaxID=91943 RepID=A0A3M7ICC6_HORWE|nr:hypothetical protein KC350_g9029 [Hortaea werneckii]OTA37799.1 hypothetical protein BTJ68_01905 [Hortaea werneckii EXF-2000]KAI6921996.1 hypothetical protein KC348_g9937 [Hortaea werneckii]KAI6925717.1 hypothetical protein KC341_g13206 [Hortaea werneckii]KAI6959517.1 hypothetical protein KC321_g13377 [Hortaea werneckii]
MSTSNGISNDERLTTNITNPAAPDQVQAPSNTKKKTNPKPGYPDSIPATSLLADFITTSKPTDLPADVQEKVQELLLDYIGVTLGAIQHAESTGPIIEAVNKLQGIPPRALATAASASANEEKGGNGAYCSVIGQGAEQRWLPQYAGLLNAALGHSLDFDDTYAPGTLHAGVTAIPAALLGAEVLLCQTPPREEATDGSPEPPLTPSAFLHAIALGYETTSLIGRELGYAAYKRGFHNTSTAGIFGAIGTLARLLRLSHAETVAAFGLAGSRAAGSMQYLANGAWNKRLHPGFAVHDAWMCVEMARAGVVGATGALEGASGVFRGYTAEPERVDLGRLVGGLGMDRGGEGGEWEVCRSSLKPFPACRMTHGFIEMIGRLGEEWGRTRRADEAVSAGVLDGGDDGVALGRERPLPEDIEGIELFMSPENFILIGDPTPNKRHPTNNIDAQFSAYFQVAHALLYGAKTGDLAAYSRLDDPGINVLTEKIVVRVDDGMKQFSARMEIRWNGGEEVERSQEFPLGEIEHPFTRERVVEKFHALAGPEVGEERAREILRLVDGLAGGETRVEDLIKSLR